MFCLGLVTHGALAESRRVRTLSMGGHNRKPRRVQKLTGTQMCHLDVALGSEDRENVFAANALRFCNFKHLDPLP